MLVIPPTLEHATTDRGDVFALTEQVLAAEPWRQSLQRGEDGAVVVFEGVVRNNTKGRPTRQLAYQCYRPMALRVMERLGRELSSAFAIGRIALVHRLGVLAVGETSVLVVVTAPHREPAFRAALEGINRLKREVPIWKKEYFEDGEVWVDGDWDDKLLVDGGAGRL